MLYTLNLYNGICQPHFNKTVKTVSLPKQHIVGFKNSLINLTFQLRYLVHLHFRACAVLRGIRLTAWPWGRQSRPLTV